MNAPLTLTPPVVYPDSDGKPMAENTKQFRWIATLKGNLDALFRDAPTVFVAGDLLWYPVEGEPTIRVAPDVMVAFGRHKGDRGSYKQFDEADIPVTVAFEVLSPGNDLREMADKYVFYTEHGVEEYYVYDPDDDYLEVYIRHGTALRRTRPANGFLSPRLAVRFDLSGEEMVVYRPDGRPFLTFEELEAERELTEQRADKAEQRADKAEQRADKAEQRADRLAELTRKVLAQQATADELQELQRLLGPST